MVAFSSRNTKLHRLYQELLWDCTGDWELSDHLPADSGADPIMVLRSDGICIIRPSAALGTNVSLTLGRHVFDGVSITTRVVARAGRGPYARRLRRDARLGRHRRRIIDEDRQSSPIEMLGRLLDGQLEGVQCSELLRLCRRFEIPVHFRELGEHGRTAQDASALFNPASPVRILVNSALSEPERAFALAHELWHYLRHASATAMPWDICREFGDRPSVLLDGLVECYSLLSLLYSAGEACADIFASALMIPRTQVMALHAMRSMTTSSVGTDIHLDLDCAVRSFLRQVDGEHVPWDRAQQRNDLAIRRVEQLRGAEHDPASNVSDRLLWAILHRDTPAKTALRECERSVLSSLAGLKPALMTAPDRAVRGGDFIERGVAQMGLQSLEAYHEAWHPMITVPSADTLISKTKILRAHAARFEFHADGGSHTHASQAVRVAHEQGAVVIVCSAVPRHRPLRTPRGVVT